MRLRSLTAATAAAAAAVLALGFTAAQADTDVGFHTPNTQMVLSAPAELDGAQDVIPTTISGWARTDTEGASVRTVSLKLTDVTGASTTVTPTIVCDEAHADCEWSALMPFPAVPGPTTAEVTMTDTADATGSATITIIVV